MRQSEEGNQLKATELQRYTTPQVTTRRSAGEGAERLFLFHHNYWTDRDTTTPARMLSRTVFIVTLASAAVSQAERLGKTSKSKYDDNKRRDGRSSTEATNVYGEPLSKCSLIGMASTGFTRTGQCVERKDDEGSHHICMDLSSESVDGKDFCETTGQDDWCKSEDKCEGKSRKKCPIKNWCVCQWAFATYLEKAGGCDHIQEIDCKATNNEAILAYEANEEKYGDALACLKERCKLDGAVEVATE